MPKGLFLWQSEAGKYLKFRGPHKGNYLCINAHIKSILSRAIIFYVAVSTACRDKQAAFALHRQTITPIHLAVAKHLQATG
jgi:hypothetical protein